MSATPPPRTSARRTGRRRCGCTRTRTPTTPPGPPIGSRRRPTGEASEDPPPPSRRASAVAPLGVRSLSLGRPPQPAARPPPRSHEVLSDPAERRWYDAHRDRILGAGQRHQAGAYDVGFGGPHGTGGGGGVDPDGVPLGRFFNPGGWSHWGDGVNGFFFVYGEAFASVARGDANAYARAAGADRGPEAADAPSGSAPDLPAFGRSDQAWAETRRFYAAWEGYRPGPRTWRWAERHFARPDDPRWHRRKCDQENERLRARARREWMDEVRSLVAFVKRRDPRVRRQAAHEAEIRAEREAAEAARKQEAAAAREAAAERWRAEERARRGVGSDADGEGDWGSDDGSAASASGRGGGAGAVDPDLCCAVCGKEFRSRGALDTHLASKKHQASGERREKREKWRGGGASRGRLSPHPPVCRPADPPSAPPDPIPSPSQREAAKLRAALMEDECLDAEGAASLLAAAGLGGGGGGGEGGADGANAADAAATAADDNTDHGDDDDPVPEPAPPAVGRSRKKKKGRRGGFGGGAAGAPGGAPPGGWNEGDDDDTPGDADVAEADSDREARARVEARTPRAAPVGCDDGPGGGRAASAPATSSSDGGRSGDDDDDAALLRMMGGRGAARRKEKKRRGPAAAPAMAAAEAEARGGADLGLGGLGLGADAADGGDWSDDGKGKGGGGKRGGRGGKASRRPPRAVADPAPQKPAPGSGDGSDDDDNDTGGGHEPRPDRPNVRGTGLSKKEKRRLKEAVASGVGCSVCGAVFPSKTQLHKHLVALGHAAPRK